jgi:hypothetical protein
MFVLTTHIIMTFLNSIFNFLILLTLVTMPHEPLTSSSSLWTKIYELLFQAHLSEPVVELDDVNTLNLKFSSEYIIWSKENDRACATIALSCQNGFKRFIQDLSACQMWLKLKKLYEVQGFNARYLTFTTLLSHHYNLFKFIENYVDQLKTLSQCLQEMNSTFSDWVILTVLLNNLEFTFNALSWLNISSFALQLLLSLISVSWLMRLEWRIIRALLQWPLWQTKNCHFSVHTVRRLIMRNHVLCQIPS